MRYVMCLALLVCLCCGVSVSVDAQQRKTQTRASRTKLLHKKKNHAPAFPKSVEVKNETVLEYDDYGRVTGAVTTITLLTAAVDADGDPLSYTWTGTVVDHVEKETFSLSEKFLKGEGLKATWRRFIFMGEPASGIIIVTASDGKGGTASHKICIGRYVVCGN